MKRITFDGNFCDIAKCADVCEGIICEEEACSQRKTWERLKAIEDILGNEYDLDRLRELVQADRERRCVVLPCKVGDPVYMATGRSRITGYEEDICDGFFIDRTGKLQIKAQNYTGNHGTYGSLEDGSVQLTREAAEKALEEMEENENG